MSIVALLLPEHWLRGGSFTRDEILSKPEAFLVSPPCVNHSRSVTRSVIHTRNCMGACLSGCEHWIRASVLLYFHSSPYCQVLLPKACASGEKPCWAMVLEYRRTSI